MAVRPLDHAPGAHLQDLAYLIAHLKGDPQATDLAPIAQAASDALQAQNQDWEAARAAVMETQSALRNIDEQLLNAVRTANRVIGEDSRYKRHTPKFMLYFPRGLADYVQTSYSEQLVAVRALAERCAQDPSPRIQEQAALLQAAADKTAEALARRDQAQVAESSAYGQLRVQKLKTIVTCRRIGADLAERCPGEADRVRSFFRLRTRRARATEPPTADPAVVQPVVQPPAAASPSASPATAAGTLVSLAPMAASPA